MCTLFQLPINVEFNFMYVNNSNIYLFHYQMAAMFLLMSVSFMRVSLKIFFLSTTQRDCLLYQNPSC